MKSVAHPLLQKQWSTSASKPLEKWILAANGQFHAAKSFFFSGKGGIFYTHSGNTAADYHVNGKESLGLSFFL